MWKFPVQGTKSRSWPSHPYRRLGRIPVMRPFVSLLPALFLAASAHAADVDALVKKLSNRDSDVRRAAAKELAEMGTEAKPALPALLKALKDDDKFVRRFLSSSDRRSWSRGQDC